MCRQTPTSARSGAIEGDLVAGASHRGAGSLYMATTASRGSSAAPLVCGRWGAGGDRGQGRERPAAGSTSREGLYRHIEPGDERAVIREPGRRCQATCAVTTRSVGVTGPFERALRAAYRRRALAKASVPSEPISNAARPIAQSGLVSAERSIAAFGRFDITGVAAGGTVT